jgi:hypothetical protein
LFQTPEEILGKTVTVGLVAPLQVPCVLLWCNQRQQHDLPADVYIPLVDATMPTSVAVFGSAAVAGSRADGNEDRRISILVRNGDRRCGGAWAPTCALMRGFVRR